MTNIKKYKDYDSNNNNNKRKNDFFEKLENDFSSLDNALSKYIITSDMEVELKQKAEKMKDFPIPYIKADSFYIKHYSNDIYDVTLYINKKQLLLHLNKHYEELKN